MANIFIVRPFGSKRPVLVKTKEGKHDVISYDFDRVEAELIKPAMEQLSLSGGTTGEIFESGDIREDMFSELLLADIIIADITIYNANVFYELGVRHALRDKRTILIKSPGFDDTPFDIIGYRYLSYDRENPAAALPDLIKMLQETKDATRKDSPVFNMLPYLKEHDVEKFLAVPSEFGEEVTIATKAGMPGKLKLLFTEAEGSPWEMQALRYLGESFFVLKNLDNARVVWEKVKRMKGEDFQANDRLSTIYQKLADYEKNNPTLASELLTKSDLAIDAILKEYKNLDITKRAETFALKGRNNKVRWIHSWRNSPSDKKEIDALQSTYLEEAFKCYENGYYENLNHFYSGINALGLLITQITLAERYPDAWALQFNSDDDAALKLKSLKDKQQKLAVSIQFALDAEKRRMGALEQTDIWLTITEADFGCLTLTRPERVSLLYKKALDGAEDFHIESMKIQLLFYKELNILSDNVEAALSIIPEVNSNNVSQNQFLLFTGHMIDDATQNPACFPANNELAIKQKIKEQVQVALNKLEPGNKLIGIAGGACGGDILFHEVCQELHIESTLFLAMPSDQYRAAFVNYAGTHWTERFETLYKTLSNVELSNSNELPKWLRKKSNYSLWERNNLWLLNSALINDVMNMSLIALWDGIEDDTPNYIANMVTEAKARGVKISLIDMKV